MPTYDYVCDACNHAFEIFQSFSEAPKKKCPDCGKRALRRVISGGVGLVFKGSGFYVNDSRSVAGSAKKSDAADGATGGTSGTAGSTSGKTDATAPSEKNSADKKSPEPKAAASAKPPAAKKQKPAAS